MLKSLAGLPFTKLHGIGNHFVVVSAGPEACATIEPYIVEILNSATGVGGDGLFIVHPFHDGAFPVSMYNPDGSPMGMCGNGVRCVVRYLHLHGLLPSTDTSGEVALQIGPLKIGSRRVPCTFEDCGRRVEAMMGVPEWGERYSLPVGDATFEAADVSFGNPHCVLWGVDDRTAPIDLARSFGPGIELLPRFSNRTNVEFVRVVDSSKIVVGVWERGAGLTLACGSGACAAASVAHARGEVGPAVEVQLPGGSVQVRFEPKSGEVYLSGPAQEVFRGELYPW